MYDPPACPHVWNSCVHDKNSQVFTRKGLCLWRLFITPGPRPELGGQCRCEERDEAAEIPADPTPLPKPADAVTAAWEPHTPCCVYSSTKFPLAISKSSVIPPLPLESVCTPTTQL